MSWKDEMYAALAKFVNVRTGFDVEKVTDFEQREVTMAGCTTCGYDETIVDISYIDARSGKHKTYTYSGSFADLMYYLTQDD